MRMVVKFGGTSVANSERIAHVAGLIAREKEAGHQVLAVTSAMAGVTNQLQEHTAAFIDPRQIDPDKDAVMASGEQVTSGLLALALKQRGIRAQALQGWQLPLITDRQFGEARIWEIEPAILESLLAQDIVPVVAGFQGITPDRRITTLGRGGSDTSAVAIAVAVKAELCEIYTDVEGVYTADPRLCRDARMLDEITYEEMLELAAKGAKVLHPRSVELAMRYQMRLSVRSSFLDQPGTAIVNKRKVVENQIITGISSSQNEAKVTLAAFPDRPGVAARIFQALADIGVNVDMIVQNISINNKTADMTFTLPKADLKRTLAALEAVQKDVGFQNILSNDNLGKVSVIGHGLTNQTGVAHEMFAALSSENINIQAISTSEIRISVLIEAGQVERAVQVLHRAFQLEKAA